MSTVVLFLKWSTGFQQKALCIFQLSRVELLTPGFASHHLCHHHHHYGYFQHLRYLYCRIIIIITSSISVVTSIIFIATTSLPWWRYHPGKNAIITMILNIRFMFSSVAWLIATLCKRLYLKDISHYCENWSLLH